MFTKIFVVLVILIIIGSLGSSLFYLVRDQKSSTKMVKALSWRIGLSLVLFLLLFVGFYFGFITPHGVRPIS